MLQVPEMGHGTEVHMAGQTPWVPKTRETRMLPMYIQAAKSHLVRL